MFDDLRMEHTQQGHSVQIFLKIPEDESASTHKLNMVKGQLCARGL